MKTIDIWKVRINYKSGHSFEGWFENFKVDQGGYSWKPYINLKRGYNSKPLELGTDIESVFQVDHRKVDVV